MEPIKYSFGIRIEPYMSGIFLGVGLTWFTEKSLQIDVLFWSIAIGKLYDIE